ncbi:MULTISPECIES: hypothetical protein [Terrabacteria group]|uniref:hypothetical protein n=1 Tax=Bacillati TaxID=1783272 RepID=UPI001C6E51DD|nr:MULTISPECIES: hypothetical protein [Terrabacteria group]MBW9212132.1 hypothetical protein [Trueperella sp. zg.1013]
MGQRARFRKTKNGYDRFAVDAKMEEMEAGLSVLTRKLELYQNSMVELQMENDRLRQELALLQNKSQEAEVQANQIKSLALNEATKIINTAHENADMMIQETLANAHSVLRQLTVLYEDAGIVKKEMKEQLAQINKELDAFKLPDLPDREWLKYFE